MLALVATALPGSGSAPQEKARGLWDTYMDAAATAVQKGDLQDAEVLWRCAVQLGDDMHDDARSFLSRMMRFITAFELKDQGLIRELRPRISRFDVSKLDDTLLPVSWMLEALANWYYEKWNESKEGIFLEMAERCRGLQWAIQKKVLPEPDADSTTLYGLVLGYEGNFDEASKKFEEASSIWHKQDQEMKERVQASSQFCVLPESRLEMEKLSSMSLYVDVLLAREYQELGKTEKSEAGNSAFAKSEQLYSRALGQLERVWPRSEDVADTHQELAKLYNDEKKYPDAEAHFKKSLQLYEELEGQQGEDVKDVAKELAAVLRTGHRETEAQGIERKYQVSNAAPQ